MIFTLQFDIFFFFFNDTATTEIYTLSLHDALPIYAAAAVDRDAVRRGELPGQDPAMRLAEPSQHLALQRMDADPRPDIRPILVDLARRATLADVAERVMAVSKAHAVRPMQIVPLGFPLAIFVEHLDAVVFAVGQIDPAL